MIKIVKDVNLFDDIDKFENIAVGTNVYCTMSQGFQRKVMVYYPDVQKENEKTKYGDVRKLGTVMRCESYGKSFAVCYICKGYNFRPDLSSEYVDYDALRKCCKLLNILYKKKIIAMPLLGGSRFDGNGNATELLKIMEEELTDVTAYVYCYHQESKSEEKKRVYEYEKMLKSQDYEMYRKAVCERKKREKMVFSRNKHTKV